MGKTTRCGFGFGMNEDEARMSFIDLLNKTYGEDSYEGGGNDIVEWLSSSCIHEPIPSQAANKSKIQKYSEKNGKLINGFLITNQTLEFQRLQFFAQYNSHISVPEVIEEYAKNISEARSIAEWIALNHNTALHVIPCRLLYDEKANRLSLPSKCLEITPVGGTNEKPGKWQFEVEVRI